MKFTKLVSSFAIGFLSLGLVQGVRAQTGPINVPITAGNLVAVTLVDVLDIGDITVQVPITIAANVCGTTVNLLAVDLGNDGGATCNATAETINSSTQRDQTQLAEIVKNQTGNILP